MRWNIHVTPPIIGEAVLGIVWRGAFDVSPEKARSTKQIVRCILMRGPVARLCS
ncbi:MAG TPA: hypothetical protein VF777_06820 [Phycisphaerales bacterium]